MRGRAATAIGVLVIAYLLALSPLLGTAAAGNAAQSREYVEKATAAYALNRYAIAAENYEKAYELSPEPAILYNAAQAHRLAGNKQRALELYEGYGRVYADDKREEIAKHIEALKNAIEHDMEVASSPPPKTLATTESCASQRPPSLPVVRLFKNFVTPLKNDELNASIAGTLAAGLRQVAEQILILGPRRPALTRSHLLYASIPQD